MSQWFSDPGFGMALITEVLKVARYEPHWSFDEIVGCAVRNVLEQQSLHSVYAAIQLNQILGKEEAQHGDVQRTD